MFVEIDGIRLRNEMKLDGEIKDKRKFIENMLLDWEDLARLKKEKKGNVYLDLKVYVPTTKE